ncbi:MAG: hypothetical protein V4581_16265 [Bacteroidota bacterium]
MKITQSYFAKAVACMALLFVLFTPNVSVAQTAFEEDVYDEGEPVEAPINNYVVAGVVAAIAMGYVVLSKKRHTA